MAFQTKINQQPAPGLPGDFASANPRASVLAGPGALVSGANGLTPGLFGWSDADGKVSNTGTGAPTGFVHREMGIASITNFLDQAGNLIMPGREVTLFNEGDFWARATTVTSIGQKVFAVLATGAVATGEAGATIAGAVETNFRVGSVALVGEVFKITTWGKQ